MKKRVSLIALITFLMALFAFIAPAAALDSLFSKNAWQTSFGGDIIDKSSLLNHPASNLAFSTTAYAVIAGDNNSQVVITSISLTSDGTAASNNCFIFDKADINVAGDSAQVDSECAAGAQTIGIASGSRTDFRANDIVLIQNASGSTVYIETVLAADADTILCHGTLDGAIDSTWQVYRMEHVATIPVQSATVSHNSDVAVFAGQKDSPVLLLLGATTAGTINFASGMYK
jgi:hypothetical protein